MESVFPNIKLIARIQALYTVHLEEQRTNDQYQTTIKPRRKFAALFKNDDRQQDRIKRFQIKSKAHRK